MEAGRFAREGGAEPVRMRCGVAGGLAANGAVFARGSVMAEPRLVLPPHAPGMRIGLFGGSFNPPHAAHRAASLYALKRLGLDRIWWLVTPGNPLKDTSA